MTTYFEISVQTYNAEDNACTSCACSKPTIETALTEGVELASFYHLSAGYPRVTIEITETCSACYGNGTIQKHAPGRHRAGYAAPRVKCPDCKGSAPMQHIGPFEFRLHENALTDLHLVTA